MEIEVDRLLKNTTLPYKKTLGDVGGEGGVGTTEGFFISQVGKVKKVVFGCGSAHNPRLP